ncbi:MAG TPA: hypothetical protein VJN92_16370 [Candidatus Acidoferrum sp.]|nr:hypothetical protein [Candidatus Acidoferrum sp.]
MVYLNRGGPRNVRVPARILGLTMMSVEFVVADREGVYFVP